MKPKMLLLSTPAAISSGSAAVRRNILMSLTSFSSGILSCALYPSVNPRRQIPLYKFIAPRCHSISVAVPDVEKSEEIRNSLLERLRTRHLKDAAPPARLPASSNAGDGRRRKKKDEKGSTTSFEELGLSQEVLGAVEEMGISVPTEIQCMGVPEVLEGKSVVLGSHTGSGKTLAYMLPLVQLLRRDEELSGMLMKPRRPRAVVLCPTRELCEQVFRVAKSISHHARFRSTMISGGGRLRPQEDSLSAAVDMVVGTPGRILQHIEEGNMVYGDIKYLVLDEADTMFDRGFGPDIRKFLGPLKNRAAKPGDQGFQTVMVTATMTKAVQKLVDEEFQGIIHLRTSSLHKKIATARHDFIKLSGSENKLEALLQVLEPSLARGNRVMVFCNTLNSSRAVDHFLGENQIYTVNYHGEVPAEERVENLKKFKSEDGDCPTLVCTDLAARGLDLDVDHVIMFDFPSNAIDYLHRTGRTARMGAKGKVTSLVAKKDLLLAERIEEAIKKNESLEALNAGSVRRDNAGSIRRDNAGSVRRDNAGSVQREINKSKQGDPKGKSSVTIKTKQKGKTNPIARKLSKTGKKASPTTSAERRTSRSGTERRASRSDKAAPSTGRRLTLSKPVKSTINSFKKSSNGSKPSENKRMGSVRSSASKLNVVGFRGRSSSGRKESARPS